MAAVILMEFMLFDETPRNNS